MNLQNITRDSIIKAIKEIDNNPKLRYGVSSSTYDVLFDNKRYPPKLVISIAYNQIENKSIKTASFHGGINTECFNVIESLGFTIVSKDKQNYFLFSPGENANKWAEFCDEGKMAMGWNIGDISKLKTYKKIEETLKETHNKKNQSSAAKANWQFLNLMKEGDIIIPKKGQRKILGYGIVKSDYYYDETKIDEDGVGGGYECVRKVEWKEIGEWDYTIKRRDTLQHIDTKQEIHEIEKLIGGFDNYESEKNLNFHNKLDLILIDDFIFLLEKIDEIILSLGLVQSDKRLTFSAEGDTLSFHIGNKYIIAFTLLKQSYFLLTPDKIKLDLPNLEMSRNTLLYKNANKANIEQNISHIIDATKKELLKKDEFPKYDSSDFRKVVFNMKYREEILNNMKKESVQNEELVVNEFLNKWPVSRMKNLKLSDYTNTDFDSFTWDMEKGLLKSVAGIQSGFKTQFGVYQSTEVNNFREELEIIGNREAHFEDFGWQLKWSPKRDNYITNKDDAFVNVINAVNQVIDYAQDGNLEKINEIKLSPNFKWKIAFIYGKQKVMSIPKSSVLSNALTQMGINFNKKNIAFMHEKLLSFKPEEVGFYDYCSEIYEKYSGKNYNNDVEKNIWFVCQGTTYKNDFAKNQLFAPKLDKRGSSKNYWDRMQDVKKGDLIIHYSRGVKGYSFSESLPYDGENPAEGDEWSNNGWCIDIDFHELEIENSYESFQEISKEIYSLQNNKEGPIQKDGGVKQGYLFKINKQILELIFKNIDMPDDVKLYINNDNIDVDFDNVMVYEVKKSAADNFKDLIHNNGKYFYWNQKKFRNLNIDDYVFLINTTNKYSSLLKLNKKDINIKIKGNNSSFTDEGQKFNVDGTYKEFVRLEIVDFLEKDYDWKTLGVSENTFLYGEHCEGLNPANIHRISQLKNIYKKNTKAIEILNTCLNGHEKSTPMKITQSLNRILFGPPGTGKTFSTINHALSILEDKTLDELKVEDREDVRERYEKFVNDDLKQIRFTTFHQSYSYEDFIEGIRPKLKSIKNTAGNEVKKEISYETEDGVFKNIVKDAIKNYPEPYVLIIDEINRGNISDILGELITLLEKSKRREGEESTIVTLPYSQKPFEIPDNIYIVGTMNTADRSISVLDTALRRRFDFVELPPNYDDLSSFLEKKGVNKKSLGIDLIELLKKINERIGFLLDKDHMIGHTYFMTVTNKESLVKVFAKNIIPLLVEYFHNDYENIQRVLGDNEIWGKKEENKIFQEKEEKTTKLFGGEVDGFDDVETFKLNKYFLNESEFSKVPSEVFTQIYEQVKSKSE